MAFRYNQNKVKTSYRNKLLFAIAIFTIALVSSILIFSGRLSLPSSTSEVSNIPDLSIEGYVKVQPDAGMVGDQGFVILTGNCYQLTANTDMTQAESIANGLVGRIDVRPNTHDLMKDALNNLEVEVIMVKIVELRNNTYYGRVILRQGNKIVSLDSRPSDGIALAVRTNSSIYIKEDLLSSQGKYIC